MIDSKTIQQSILFLALCLSVTAFMVKWEHQEKRTAIINQEQVVR